MHDIPALPIEMAIECIKHGEYCINNNVEMMSWYARYEFENKNSVAYCESLEEFHGVGNESGGVGHFYLPKELNRAIIDYYSSIENPIQKNDVYLLQVCTGGRFVAPHIDDKINRLDGYLNILKAGGPNVRTKWYEVKPEYNHLEKTEYSGIPYHRLDVVEDQCLQENNWYYFNFSEIHSVENQESLRIALWPHFKT